MKEIFTNAIADLIALAVILFLGYWIIRLLSVGTHIARTAHRTPRPRAVLRKKQKVLIAHPPKDYEAPYREWLDRQ